MIADRRLTRCATSCRALAGCRTDAWLAELFEAAAGRDRRVALVAVGGYGRAELAPESDLDVLLLHGGRHAPDALAEPLWYPVWDAKLKLGHAVRTPKEALRAGLRRPRHGDVPARPSATWPATSLTAEPRRRRAGAVAEAGQALARPSERAGSTQRHARAGEVAFLLEPNLKEGRGGLRDVHALRWAAWPPPPPGRRRRRGAPRRLRRPAGGPGRAAPRRRSPGRRAAARRSRTGSPAGSATPTRTC